MRRRRREDAGSSHVLEAVIIATIMVCSVVYVATFQAPSQDTERPRASLSQRATDALNILADTPVPGSNWGDSQLATYVAECMQGNCTRLTAKLDTMLPPGTAYSLSISNGFETFPVYNSSGAPPGEAVTVSHLMEPRWSYTFVATGLSLSNPSRDAVETYALPIYNSNTLDQGGSPLRILVHGSRRSDGSNFTLSAAYSTQSIATADAQKYPAAALYFVDEAGNPLAAEDIHAATSSSGAPTLANLHVRLRVAETANVSIPAGTEVRVSLPRAWNASASAPLNDGWTLVNATADPTGSAATSDLVARTNATVRNGHLDFRFNATYRGDMVEDYLLHATLSKGALAEANLIVRADSRTSNTYAMPMVVASVPRPLGAGVPTNWTIAASIPSPKGSAASLAATDIVDITSIEIIEQDGRAIFGSASVVSGGGTVSIVGDRIVWRGEWASSEGLLNLSLSVASSGVPSPVPSRAAFAPPVDTGNWTGRMTQQVGTGFYRTPLLPATSQYGGYDTSASLAAQTNHTLGSNGTFRATDLPGTGNYTVANVTSVVGSVQGSYVGVQRRHVDVGGTAIVDIDVQSLLFALASAGQKAGVTLNVYPPWSGGERKAIASTTGFDAALLSSDVTAMTALDVNADGFADPILGTSNGRVLALHAVTGGRIEGDVFNAPASREIEGQSSAPQITKLATIDIEGSTYLVASTDQGSVFVLDRSLDLVWDWYQGSGPSNLAVKVVSLDTSADVDGDGRRDVVAGLQPRDTTTAGGAGLVYVLRALGSSGGLVPYRSDGTDDAFYTPIGTPSAVLGLGRIGQDAATGGIATTFQYTMGVAGADTLTQNPNGMKVNLPRAGLRGVAANGSETWTFFGSPVTQAAGYDYDGDNMTDIVGGSPAGYVFMMNGRQPTQPIYSVLIVPASETIASATHDQTRSVILTKDGSIYFTNDGWLSYQCAGCDPTRPPYISFPTARAIAANATTKFWVGGLANGLWRSVNATDTASAAAVEMTAVTPVGTRAGAPFDFTQHVYDISDMTFLWGDEGDKGWAIGTSAACLPEAVCEQSLVMRTEDGGASWIVANDSDGTLLPRPGHTTLIVNEPLHRIRMFEGGPAGRVGWIAGDGGTLLRSLDGGVHWWGVSVDSPVTSANFTDVACAHDVPTTCIVVGEGGQAWRTTNAHDAWPTWTPLDLVQATNGRTLLSVGLADAKTAYVGASNMILKSWDGGNNWSALPMNYIEANGNRVDVLADGTGFIYGGNLAHQRTFILADYAMRSRAQTYNIGGGIPLDAKAVAVDVEVNVSQLPANATVTFNASADGGVTWVELFANTTALVPAPPPRGLLGEMDPMYPKSTFHLDEGSAVLDYVLGLTAGFGEEAARDVRFRMDFHNTGDASLESAWVKGGHINVTWEKEDGEAGQYTVPLTDDLRDPAQSTAVWDTASGGIRQPVVQEYWTRNVSGSVQDVEIGADVSGDARKEIYVATGGVIAENSPDSAIYAGSDASKYQYPDNRVYLLDGNNGSIVAQTESFDGPVTHLALGGEDGSGEPAYLFAAVWDGTAPLLVALDPLDLSVLWTTVPGATEPSGLVASEISGSAPTAVVSSRMDPASEQSLSGRTMAYVAQDGTQAWGSIPDQQGHYTVNVPIEKDWFFGPYVVEVGVDWNATATEVVGGVQQTKQVVQTARFYDYFLVTPPGALSPPSPIYNVQLTVWSKEWR